MWVFNNQPFTEVIEEFEAFVYLIERLNDAEGDRFYIGKKVFYNKSKLKGKRIYLESDWWDYYGSSDDLSKDILKYGKDNFKRTILHLCRTRGDSGYMEAFEQMKRNVLEPSNEYYNKNIFGRYMHPPSLYKFTDTNESYVAFDHLKSKKSKIWITDGKTNRLVPKNMGIELIQSSNWNEGKYEKKLSKIEISPKHKEINFKYKFSIYNKDEQKWVESMEEGWKIHTDTKLSLNVVNNGVDMKTFTNKDECSEFILKNPDYNFGRFKKQELVYAWNIESNSKVLVSREDLKLDDKLVSVGTKRVKIRSGRKIIFQGFLETFIVENPEYKIKDFIKCLKTGELVYGKFIISLLDSK